ncbi:DUF4031 domain-containing protein [Planctomycetota bacterium]|nr:DUF4031 domain-containing protein [Planctomycetota bacterium]
MAVFVDSLLDWGWELHGHRVKSCHMFSDDMQELFQMADRLGLQREWLHGEDRLPHFDLPADKRVLAISQGAEEVTIRFTGRFMRQLKQQTD